MTENQIQKFWQIVDSFEKNELLKHLMIVGSWAEVIYEECNIVEGFGRRRYKNEFIQFLTYSLSSCDETREHLDFIFETESLKDKKAYDYFIEGYDHLGKMLSNFISSVERGRLGRKTN